MATYGPTERNGLYGDMSEIYNFCTKLPAWPNPIQTNITAPFKVIRQQNNRRDAGGSMRPKVTTSLKPELNLVEERIQSSELQTLSSRVERLQTSHTDLVAKASELKGGITVVGLVFTLISLIFAILSGLAGYNIYKVQQFDGGRAEQLEFFVDSFQKELEATIDRVSFVNPVDKQSYRVQELTDIQKRINELGITSERLTVRSVLADATILVIEQKYQEASLK